MMSLGTFLVILFSDPMVGVFSEVGNRTGIRSFYISFVMAPLASNASELLAAFNYASKKTQKTVSISFSTLEGAGCMNNTFCLGIFLALIAFRQLAWEFSAETISILLVEVAMFLFTLKPIHTQLDALIILSLFPISICVVALLEMTGLN